MPVFIEKPGNVYGHAWVSGNARVSGDAQVYGNAQVCGDAWVSGIVHSGKWERSPLFVQGPRHSFSHCSPDRIHIGCECRTIKNWKENAAKIGREHGYSDQDIEFYLKLIALL